MVTGCTAGVGRAYTVELARRGVNVVLISRNVDKLNELAREVGEFLIFGSLLVYTV